MSNEDKGGQVKGQFDPILKTITDADIRQFLDHAQGTMKCWFCGQNSLHPLRAQYPDSETGELRQSEDRPAFIAMPVQSDLEDGFEIRIPAFVISCSNCGYSCNMAATPLMAWKREQADGD